MSQPQADNAARSAELEQLARESIQNAEHLTERKNYSGAIKEYQRAAELRKQTAAKRQEFDPVTRIAEIRQENRGGDVSYRDIDWLCDLVMIELRPAIARLTKERDQAVAALEQIEDTLYKARYPHA